MTKDLFEDIIKKIESYDVIIIHRHVRPDPDAIGSQGGLAEMIRCGFPQKTVYTVGEVPDSLSFLGVRKDEITRAHFQQALVIVLDTANQPRIDDQRYSLAESIIKIDHHPDNDQYGDISWVEDTASSTSEMIVSLSEASNGKLPLNEKSASLLYSGIVGDTGRFLYDATKESTFLAAAKLVATGANIAKIGRELDQIPLNVSRLMGWAYEHLDITPEGLGTITLTDSIFRRFKVSEDETSQVVPMIGRIDSIRVWVVFVDQRDGTYRCRIRSKGVVINKIAEKYNGGGHPLASGAKVDTSEERKGLVTDLLELLKQHPDRG